MAPEPTKQQTKDEPTLASVLDKLAAIQQNSQNVQQAQLDQMKPVNVERTGISVFNPRGDKSYPLPELKCTVFLPWQQKPGIHGLDREEVELFNLLQPGVYKIDLTDGSTVTAEVVGAVNKVTGKLEEMHLSGPYDPDTRQHSALFTKELKQMFPAMRVMLRQMIGEPANAVLTMKQEAARIALPADDPKRLAVSVA